VNCLTHLQCYIMHTTVLYILHTCITYIHHARRIFASCMCII
jgi:hypothetical protein